MRADDADFLIIHGDSREKGAPLTLMARIKIFTQAYKLGVRCLVIIGDGEPTEHFTDLLKPTITAAHNQGLFSIVFTTASQLSVEQAEFYRDHYTSPHNSDSMLRYKNERGEHFKRPIYT